MKTSINALLLSVAIASTSFSASAADMAEEYQHYTFSYLFTEQVDLVLTHYLQMKQEMDQQLHQDITQQASGFFSQFEQPATPQLAQGTSGLSDRLGDGHSEQTETR